MIVEGPFRSVDLCRHIIDIAIFNNKHSKNYLEMLGFFFCLCLECMIWLSVIYSKVSLVEIIPCAEVWLKWNIWVIMNVDQDIGWQGCRISTPYFSLFWMEQHKKVQSCKLLVSDETYRVLSKTEKIGKSNFSISWQNQACKLVSTTSK